MVFLAFSLLFQRICGFGKERKSLVNLRVFLDKNQKVKERKDRVFSKSTVSWTPRYGLSGFHGIVPGLSRDGPGISLKFPGNSVYAVPFLQSPEPKGPGHIKNTTVILIHDGGSKSLRR